MDVVTYIVFGVGLVLFGLAAMLFSSGWTADAYFKEDAKTLELAKVLARRKELEAFPSATWRAIGAIAILLGILDLATWISGAMAFALMFLSMAWLLVIAWVRMGRRGDRRSAPLVPRHVGSVVAWYWYVLGLVSALYPLLYVPVHLLMLPAILVSLSSFAIIAAALYASKMPALIAGDDPELELRVDSLLRRKRIVGALGGAIGVSWVFVCSVNFGTVRSEPASIAELLAFACYWAFCIGCAGPTLRLRIADV